MKRFFAAVSLGFLVAAAPAVAAPPVPHITSPANGSLFDAGTTVNLAGSATDPEDGTVPPSRLSWQVTEYESGTPIDQAAPQTGSTATIDVSPDFPVDALYDVALTATDSGGSSATTRIQLDPHVTTIAIDSDPPGAGVTWNGLAGPSVQAVVGSSGFVDAPDSFQDDNNAWWAFSSWSDGGASDHTVPVTGDGMSLKATYVPGTDPGVPPYDPGCGADQGCGPGGSGDGGGATGGSGNGLSTTPIVDSLVPASGLRMTKRGAIRVPLGNRNDVASIGSFELRSTQRLRVGNAKPRILDLVRAAFIVAPGERHVVTVHLSPALRKLVARQKLVPVELILHGHDLAGRKGGAREATLLRAGRVEA